MSSMGNKKNHFNVKIVKSGFKQLASSVNAAADLTAVRTLQNAGAFTMSFDAAENVPTNVPGTGTIQVTTVDAEEQFLEGAVTAAANAAIPAMQQSLAQLLREEGL